MGFFENIARRKKEKAIDSSIENVKQLIVTGEYAEARHILGILKDEYRQDDILSLRKKAYPVEVKTLANEKDSAYECGYRSLHFANMVKATDEVKKSCHKGCSYEGADGCRRFCRIDEHEKYRNLAREFSNYWGCRVFFVIEDINKVYILAVEADKELWNHDRVMAYCITDEDVRKATYAEVYLDSENGIPVIAKYTSQHKAEKDEYIEKVKNFFSQEKHQQVVEAVEYMEKHLHSSYRSKDMEEIHDMYRKSKDFLQKFKAKQKKEALLRLDMLAKEGLMDGKAFIWFKNDRLCASVFGEDDIPVIKVLEEYDDLYLLAKSYEEELDCMVYHVTDDGHIAYLFVVDRDSERWEEERPEKGKISAIVHSLDENDYCYYYVNVFNNNGSLGVKDSDTDSDTSAESSVKDEFKEEAKARLRVLTDRLGLNEMAYSHWCECRICCSRIDAEGKLDIFPVEESSNYSCIIAELEEKVGCLVYHIVDAGEDLYLLNIHFDSGCEYGRLWENSDTISLLHCNSENLNDFMFWDMDVSVSDGVIVIEDNDEVEDEVSGNISAEDEISENTKDSITEETDKTTENSTEEDESVETPQLIKGYNAEQWFNTGFKYLNGDGVAKNLTKALICMENAAKLGEISAMHNCSIMYSQGQGVAVDDEKAFYWTRKAAEGGYSTAMYNLFFMYCEGKNCQRDDSVGLMWLKKSAEAGCEPACMAFARVYAEGHFNEPQDKAKALYWYEKAANLGNDDAMMKCFCAYVDGVGCEKDVDKGVYWLQEALKKENADALYRMGEMELRAAKTPEDVKRILSTYLIPSANKGDADALFLCAEAFRVGSGVGKDEVKALELYTHSAERGCEVAQKFLVKVYTEGGIAQPDNEKALYWKEKLAENNAELAVELAEVYATMDGDENSKKALKWFHRAVHLGSVKAMLFFAHIYKNNNDDEGAFKYELMAAEHGNVIAMDNIAIRYSLGLGTEKNMEKSLYWREKAAEGGYIRAQYNCAVIYSEGEDVEVDFEKAFFWIQKALENVENVENDFKATIYYCAAFFYITGNGTELNEKKAYEFYEKAALLGEKDAYPQLVNLCIRGIAGNIDTAFDWAVKAAEDGDGGELLLYGGSVYISNDEDIPVDMKEAMRWIEKSAEFGDFTSVFIVGLHYYNDGSGKKYDDEKALYWLEKAYENIDKYDDSEKCQIFNMLAALNRFTDDEKAYCYYQMAAELGDISAMNDCCSMCLNDIVEECGNSNALRWAEKAAKLGNTSILMAVAGLFDEGKDFTLDKKEALRWYEKAAEYGDVQAMRYTAKMYSIGEGCTKDPHKAIYWLEKVADQGDTSSMLIIADYYNIGVDVEMDFSKAYFWYQKAANGGNPVGMYNTALKHLLGLGTEVSIEKAKHWLKKAQSCGNETVNKQIEKLLDKFGFAL